MENSLEARGDASNKTHSTGGLEGEERRLSWKENRDHAQRKASIEEKKNRMKNMRCCSYE